MNNNFKCKWTKCSNQKEWLNRHKIGPMYLLPKKRLISDVKTHIGWQLRGWKKVLHANGNQKLKKSYNQHQRKNHNGLHQLMGNWKEMDKFLERYTSQTKQEKIENINK